jgi:hypothetical protein
MKEWQRHSRFPKSDHITKKNRLAKSFRTATKNGMPFSSQNKNKKSTHISYQGTTGLDFLPNTYVLPDDWKAFMYVEITRYVPFANLLKRKCMNKEKAESEKTKDKSATKVGGPWIVKPHDAAGGHGISLVQNLSDIGYLGMLRKKLVVSQYDLFTFLINNRNSFAYFIFFMYFYLFIYFF